MQQVYLSLCAVGLDKGCKDVRVFIARIYKVSRDQPERSRRLDIAYSCLICVRDLDTCLGVLPNQC